LVRDVEQGIAEHRYLRGMLFPEASEVQRLYALSAPEVESVIRRLRADRLLQRHDEYRDTYFIDVGRADRRLRPGPCASAEQTEQVARLTALVEDLAARVRRLESLIGKPDGE
jgi:hypothetical protein